MTLIAQVHAGLHSGRCPRASNLTSVKLLGRKKDNSGSDNVADSAASDAAAAASGTPSARARAA